MDQILIDDDMIRKRGHSIRIRIQRIDARLYCAWKQRIIRIYAHNKLSAARRKPMDSAITDTPIIVINDVNSNWLIF